MLKKIKTSELCIGMYVQEFCSSWIDTPFWKKSFLLDNPDDLIQIRKTKIQEVWIDISKGLDIGQLAPVQTEKAALAEPVAPVVAARVQTPASMDEEIGRASSIVNRSKQAVYSMFNEARMGKAVSIDQARIGLRRQA